MKKCDFCEYSKLRFGRLVCSFDSCVLNEDDVYEIMDRLARINIKKGDCEYEK